MGRFQVCHRQGGGSRTRGCFVIQLFNFRCLRVKKKKKTQNKTKTIYIKKKPTRVYEPQLDTQYPFWLGPLISPLYPGLRPPPVLKTFLVHNFRHRNSETPNHILEISDFSLEWAISLFLWKLCTIKRFFLRKCGPLSLFLIKKKGGGGRYALLSPVFFSIKNSESPTFSVYKPKKIKKSCRGFGGLGRQRRP